MKAFRALAVASAAATFLLVMIGAVVRVSGSGLGCGSSWPLCRGSLVPLFDLPTFLEWTHQLVSGIVVVLAVATAAVAWLRLRGRRNLLWLANAALVLLVLQSLLGAATVKLNLPPQVVMAHLAAATLVLAALLMVATLSGPASALATPADSARTPLAASSTATLATPAGFRSAPSAPPGASLSRPASHTSDDAQRLYGLSLWSTLAGFVLLLSGSLVTDSGAAGSCPDWPLCSGLAFPAQGLPAIHLAHRLVAAAIGLLILYTAVTAIRRGAQNPGAARAGYVVAVGLALQVLVGGLQVVLHFPPELVAGHIALAEAVWGGLVILTVLAYRERAESTQPGAVAAAGFRQTFSDYLALTKPEIISLLLVTTICTMFIATRGMPSPWIILWTTIGGALSAGGANALNCYVDQDIDQEMTRTRRRPIPAGRMEPQRVLIFGLTLAVTSFMVMLLGVNMLAAVLSLSGLLFYVFVYTLWLKRSTPQNIVIGGAAGAVPPLVGWAAVTGRVDLAAWWLFAIIFFWTPPHFWALALLIKKDYARAGVPMLPVVRSENYTRWQIVIYALLLLPLSIALFATGAVGVLYLILAVALTGVFIWYAIRLLRAATLAWARKTYRYSLLYLALLFGSMVLDHAVGGLI